MKDIPHHIGNTCYEHSVFVAYTSFCLAHRLGLDYMAAARGGLLHDLYLYDPDDKSNYEGHQCFAHPKVALTNAKKLCPDLTSKEENIILSHMWPLSKAIPMSPEAALVSTMDKCCATAEVMRFWHRSTIRDCLFA